jgi:alkane 1-monooxygenase
LRYLDAAPELPAGYAASILLALIPPLWRLVMDPKALAHRADEDERLAA